MKKAAVHAFLFLLAILVAWAGLVAGLQYNSDVGTALVITAAAVAGLNIFWMVKGRR